MKASDLIRMLQEQIDKHGDLPVRYYGFEWERNPFEVIAYDKDGERNDKRVEIFIH